jgi:alpha,alpha-trehalose phosphorylase
MLSPETKKRNFDFYDPLTTGDSSLSSCVEAIIAGQIGDLDKAIRYGMAALLMDLAPTSVATLRTAAMSPRWGEPG